MLQRVQSFGWFAALIFVIAAALRLARFNTVLDDPDRPAWHGHFFTGMPAPAGAIVALLPLYLQLSSFNVPNARLPVGLDIGYLIFVAFLMASWIPHFSGKKIGRIPPEYFMVILFGVAAVLLLLATFPMEMMIVLSIAYLSTMPFAIRSYRRYERAAGETDPGWPAGCIEPHPSAAWCHGRCARFTID